ncbi:MAG: undecaprenyl-diphosphate phosphatase [bacterium]|nr:undecaprenyl-diphosphate phosphatase [bacterium]
MPQLILMGIIQGLTEFLPVSSSGHLLLLQSVFGLKNINLAVDVLLHLATLLVIIVYYFRPIQEIALRTIRSPFSLKTAEVRLFYLILLANVPTAVIGLLLKKGCGFLFERSDVLYFTWPVMALLLFLSDRLRSRENTLPTLTVVQSLVIGICQGIAVLPGISRSGAAILACLFLGLNRRDSVKLSFLIGLPAMLGAFLLEFKDIAGLPIPLLDLFIASAAAFCVGYLAIRWLLKYVNSRKLSFFGYYILFMVIVMGIKNLLLK